jgi:predicted ATPase
MELTAKTSDLARYSPEYAAIEMAIKTMSASTSAKTSWYVITGGPGSGKTTTVNLLKDRGYKTTIEHARHYIDTHLVQGRTVEDIRSNQQDFQLGVLHMQIEQEAALLPNDTVFLDRAIPDALAYHLFLNLPLTHVLLDALSKATYRKVFILDLLPLINDYARREDTREQIKIHELLTVVYQSLPFPIVQVSVLPAEERVNFILNNL